MLTPAGWPRPIQGRHPVPWVSPSDDLASMNAARAAACASGAICAVCGGDYADDEVAYALVRAKNTPADLKSVNVHAMDNGILHFRCLLLALSHCPKLVELRAAGLLQIIQVESNSAKVILNEAGEPRAQFDGAKCDHVRPETLERKR